MQIVTEDITFRCPQCNESQPDVSRQVVTACCQTLKCTNCTHPCGIDFPTCNSWRCDVELDNDKMSCLGLCPVDVDHNNFGDHHSVKNILSEDGWNSVERCDEVRTKFVKNQTLTVREQILLSQEWDISDTYIQLKHPRVRHALLVPHHAMQLEKRDLSLTGV